MCTRFGRHGRVKRGKQKYLWEGETLRPRIKATFTYAVAGCCFAEPEEEEEDADTDLPPPPRLTILMQALMTPTISSPHSATYTQKISMDRSQVSYLASSY